MFEAPTQPIVTEILKQAPKAGALALRPIKNFWHGVRSFGLGMAILHWCRGVSIESVGREIYEDQGLWTCLVERDAGDGGNGLSDSSAYRDTLIENLCYLVSDGVPLYGRRGIAKSFCLVPKAIKRFDCKQGQCSAETTTGSVYFDLYMLRKDVNKRIEELRRLSDKVGS